MPTTIQRMNSMAKTYPDLEIPNLNVPCSLIAPTGGSSLEKSLFDMKISTKIVYDCTTYDNAKKQSSQEKSTYRRNNENWLVLLTTCIRDRDKPRHTHINFKRPPSPLLIQFQERVEGQHPNKRQKSVWSHEVDRREEETKTLSQVTVLRLGCLRKRKYPRTQTVWDRGKSPGLGKRSEKPSCGPPQPLVHCVPG